MKKLAVASLVLLAGAGFALAHPSHEHGKKSGKGERLVVAQGSALAGALALYKGLDKPVGVSVVDLQTIDLGAEIGGMGKRQMRSRMFTIAPGGSVPIHPHNDRPGHAYIVSGEITEYRNDQPLPLIRKAGDVAVEKNDVQHAWINHTNEPVRVLVVDIFNQ
ncbi:MAG: cupin domain-containing protein [Bosea sp. (in: a-proteobacteria)]